MRYQSQECGHHGLHGDPAAGHVVEGHDHAFVVALIVYNSAPVLFVKVLGLKRRDVIPMVVKYQVRMMTDIISLCSVMKGYFYYKFKHVLKSKRVILLLINPLT